MGAIIAPMESLDGYRTARRAAVVIDRSSRGAIVLSGRDRLSYLHGLLTNDVRGLEPGRGCYAAYLTPQGRMISDVWVYARTDDALVVLGLDMKNLMRDRLEQLVFSEDVQVRDVTDLLSRAAIVGPEAARVVTTIVEGTSREALDLLTEHGHVEARCGEHRATVVRVTDTGEPGFDLYVEDASNTALAAAIARAGVPGVAEDVAEVLRVEAGVPRFHQDMDETTIPLEAGLEARAISFTKGCYVGQEVIVRIVHRGHGKVAKRLVGLTIAGVEPPPMGGAILHDGQVVGAVTSSVVSSALSCPIALGYVPRELGEPGTALAVETGPAVVTALPFVGGR